MSKADRFPALPFLLLMLVGLTGSARGEEVLTKSGAEVLGWQLSETQFRSCSGNAIAIEGGAVSATNEKCSREDRFLENDRRRIEGRQLIIIEPDPLTDERVVQTLSAAPTNVQLLNIPSIRKELQEKAEVTFPANQAKVKTKVSVKLASATTKRIFTEFSGLGKSPLPTGSHLVLWAVSPENKIIRLGPLTAARGNKARIQTETAMKDFGLFVTMENSSEPVQPSGPIILRVINKLLPVRSQ